MPVSRRCKPDTALLIILTVSSAREDFATCRSSTASNRISDCTGCRRSWLAAARKWDLAWTARSASALAPASALRPATSSVMSSAVTNSLAARPWAIVTVQAPSIQRSRLSSPMILNSARPLTPSCKAALKASRTRGRSSGATCASTLATPCVRSPPPKGVTGA